MARGQRKCIEEKNREKEEMIAALKVRIQSEERELADLKKEKRNKDIEAISSLLEAANIGIEEAKEIIEQHVAETAVKTA